jgi:hypothetical protein
MAVIRCDRCNRRYRNQDGWNVIGRKGVIVGYLCPACQTPEENAEAEIKAATLSYFRDSEGRVVTRPKTAIPELRDDEMWALANSGRSDLKFAALSAAHDDGEEIAKLMFVVGENGPFGYTPLGQPRPEPMTIATLVERFSQQYGG